MSHINPKTFKDEEGREWVADRQITDNESYGKDVLIIRPTPLEASKLEWEVSLIEDAWDTGSMDIEVSLGTIPEPQAKAIREAAEALMQAITKDGGKTHLLNSLEDARDALQRSK